ncbi:MAG: Uma2 family endonuclease [Cyanobacteria bacterium P01_H01_bin.21]
MAQAKLKPLTFAEYLNYDDSSDIRYDLLSNGEIIPLPNESEENDYLAMVLFMKLSALISFRLVKSHTLTMEVEPIGDRYKNRRPDLVVLKPEHLQLESIIKQNALPLGVIPPQFIAEVVSPGNESSDNYRRDYEWKRQQYERWGIPEYWIVDPTRSQVSVLTLVNGIYNDQCYSGDQVIASKTFPTLQLTPNSLFDS